MAFLCSNTTIQHNNPHEFGPLEVDPFEHDPVICKCPLMTIGRCNVTLNDGRQKSTYFNIKIWLIY